MTVLRPALGTAATAAAAAAAAVAALSLLGAAPALAACDAYSGGCTSDAPPPARLTQEPAVQSPTTLPFTGGQLVLLTATGAAALAGGTALVVAARRPSASD